MKKSVFISVLLLSFLGFTSCQKNFEEKQSPQTEDSKDLDQNIFSSDFNWETAQNIEISLTSSREEIINIKSTDGKTRFYKAKHPGSDKEILVRINIPTSIKSLLINEKEVDISSGKVSESLNQ